MLAFEYEVLCLEGNVRKLRGQFEGHMRALQTQVNEVDDKVIRMQEMSRKEAYREICGRVSPVDGCLNDLQEQIDILNGDMAEIQGHAKRMTEQTSAAETEIDTLSHRIQEVSETSHDDQEEHMEQLEKRINEQDQEIASLKEKLQRALATLGHIVDTGSLPPSGPGAAHT